ncbi:MAG TPA: DegV family protein [Candidatus Limnocylindrales bacterium]|jgi:DegV family protein with EDD domain|nr:DegV family protein [Candidatus Limnocylindrales bacterium]
MPTTAVVTDSTADLMSAQAAGAGIRVVPLFVQFGADSFQVGVDLTTEQFWDRLLAPGAPIPSTAAPAPGTFKTVFEQCFADGADAVVCPVIGSGLSGTFQSATVAASMLADREIHVIDTRSTSMATGLAALMAAELAATGIPAAEIAERVTARLPDLDLYVAVDGLEFLRKGGRLSAAQSVVGNILSVKPIITVRDGHVTMADRQRSRAKARAKVIELIAAHPIERLAIVHTPTSSAEEVQAFRDALVGVLPGLDPSAITVSLLGASTGPHLGPDLMGACFLAKAGSHQHATA